MEVSKFTRWFARSVGAFWTCWICLLAAGNILKALSTPDSAERAGQIGGVLIFNGLLLLLFGVQVILLRSNVRKMLKVFLVLTFVFSLLGSISALALWLLIYLLPGALLLQALQNRGSSPISAENHEPCPEQGAL